MVERLCVLARKVERKESGWEIASVRFSALSNILLTLSTVDRSSRNIIKTCTPSTVSKTVSSTMTIISTTWTASTIVSNTLPFRGSKCQYILPYQTYKLPFSLPILTLFNIYRNVLLCLLPVSVFCDNFYRLGSGIQIESFGKRA